MRNLLIIYVSRTTPMRASQRDHLWSFRNYAEDCRCFYVNVAFGGIPWYIRRVRFDLILFHWSFVGSRVSREWFAGALKRISPLKEFSGIKVAMPQDEFISMDLMCDFINEFGVNTVFSVAPEKEWPKIYRTVDPKRVKFIRVLTGYLDEGTVRQWSNPADPDAPRRIDIGYRTVSQAIWGRFNLLKGELAHVFGRAAGGHSLSTDIAVGAEHFKLGDEWLRFLSGCRFTLGIEGGSSLLDWDGSLSDAISSHLRRNPNADFDELERECIPLGKDGEIDVVAISPRHLEACLTRTGQVLVEGEYNGVLRPYEHYIPLRKDFGNLDEVLSLMKDEPRRREMVDKAFRDVVESGKYSYRNMVREVLSVLSDGRDAQAGGASDSWMAVFPYAVNRVAGMLDSAFVYLYSRARDARNALRGRPG